MRTLIAGIAFLMLVSSQTSCQKKSPPVSAGDAEIEVKVLAEGFSHPWEVLWGPDNKLWLTERGGKISQVDPATGAKTTVLTINDVFAQGEGGLLGMAFHPNFAANPQVFVVYNYNKAGNYTEKGVRYSVSGTTLSGPVVILDNIAAGGIHNGSRLAFGPDQKLYITTGETGNTSLSQNINSLNGKILRINTDGTVPSDNPDPSSPIWTIGHRNPQGLVFANNRLYSSEHGPTVDDEINIIEKNRNYGWPNVEGKCNDAGEQAFCVSKNVAEPIMSWSPTIAPAGMEFYNGTAIPQWRNSLLLAVLKNSVLIQVKLNDAGDKVVSSAEYLKGTYGRLRDVCVAPDGKVYVITDNGSDQLLVISAKK